jgi:hypothetical protein
MAFSRLGRTVRGPGQRPGLNNGAKRAMRRLTRAGGAGRTGLANLIELTAASSVGDAFVAVALAGTLFFSASVDQARGRVALALLITIALVRGAGPVHRPAAGPGSAGTAVHPGLTRCSPAACCAGVWPGRCRTTTR